MAGGGGGLALMQWIGIAGAGQSLNQQLWEAAQKKDLRLVKTVLDRGAAINTTDQFSWSPLTHAPGTGHFDAVSFQRRGNSD